VGSSHHRKTHSRGTSIDWSLQIDLAPVQTTPTNKTKTTGDHDESMSTLKKEESTCIRLPSYVDRLVLMGKKSDNSSRWFPYAYEVVIMQWCAILIAQRRLTEKAGTPTHVSQGSDEFDAGSEAISQAAIRSIGVAVASAPFLFEVIKQSLGFRLLTLFRKATVDNAYRACPPLVKLDETLMLNLEQAISMVTDACLDSRNFGTKLLGGHLCYTSDREEPHFSSSSFIFLDSWELRRMSIDVNDSIVRFLRDMFSFLAPASVHRLMLIYLSRFVTKEGKQWQGKS